MEQQAVRAVFMRGGSSRALFFHRSDLPDDRAGWDPIFLAAMGSPDPGGRQLNGMGGGVSSLSKVAVIGPPTHPDADVDYTFAQVAVRGSQVGYGGNCGNISAAVGPFAIDEGLVPASGERARVRIHNTNTGKLIHAEFGLSNGRAKVGGDFAMPGVAGTGDPVGLSFVEPGGASTGRLLPTAQVRDILDVPGLGPVAVSMVDVANPIVFVAAASVGMTGTEMPAALDAEAGILAAIEEIRIAGAVAMGLVETAEEARTVMTNLPIIGVVAAPTDAPTLSGDVLPADGMDVLTRMFSSGQPHRATPATAAMCLAAAAQIPGTVVADLARPGTGPGRDLRLAHPSGQLTVGAAVDHRNGEAFVERTTVYRTARRLMEGAVLVPAF